MSQVVTLEQSEPRPQTGSGCLPKPAQRLGLMEPGAEADYAARLHELAEGLRTTILVRNAGEFAGNLI